MKPITKRQKEILDYISDYIENKGYAPMYEEIRGEFGLSAVSTVHEHIETLVKKGYLKRHRGRVRNLTVPKKPKPWLEIPLSGVITAGKPIEAVEETTETIKVAKDPSLKGELYALKVRGDSMAGDGIFDGDIVIFRKKAVPENGDTVVAVIDDNEATLKKIYKENNRIRLEPANPDYKPVYRKNAEVRGVVIKIIRNFK
jgi:SOS regulatory protein LexA